jgi:hypothetical protein
MCQSVFFVAQLPVTKILWQATLHKELSIVRLDYRRFSSTRQQGVARVRALEERAALWLAREIIAILGLRRSSQPQ